MTAQSAEISTLLERILATFTSSGVAWALLRGRAELMTGRDVDLLVAAAHQPMAEEVVLELGGVPLPQWKDPWHRMYIFDVPDAGTYLKLDIVNQLVYSRELQIASGLERGCLDRRVRDGSLFLLSPTDTFWTILLHCVLDWREVKEERAEELMSMVDDLVRPSPGEEFFASLCPSDWSAQRAVDCVIRRDWEPLGRLGLRILSTRMADDPTAPTSDLPDQLGRPVLPPRLIDKLVRPSAVTGAVYRRLWRALGLAVVPGVFDVVEGAGVDATVIGLTRRPGRCDVVLVVEDSEIQRLLPTLRAHYRPVVGQWRRLKAVGLESVRLVPASELSPAGRPDGERRERPLPLPGRSHCRLALESSWAG